MERVFYLAAKAARIKTDTETEHINKFTNY